MRIQRFKIALVIIPLVVTSGGLFSCHSAKAANAELDEEVILEVQSQQGLPLGEPLLARTMQRPGMPTRVFLPLFDIAERLGLKVEESVPGSELKVFFSETKYNSFSLPHCLKEPTLEYCSSLRSEQRHLLLATDYMTVQLLWPVEVDLKQMRVILRLPEVSGSQRRGRPSSGTRPLDLHRDVWGTPALRTEFTAISPEPGLAGTVTIANPVRRWDSELYLHEERRLRQGKWTLSQQFPDEDRGPISLKKVELLSTQVLGAKHLFNPVLVNGVLATSLSDSSVGVFETQNIRRKGPPRSKVELLINGMLWAETVIDGYGDFEFLEVPLFYGRNEVVFRYTSPLGVRQDESQTYDISADLSQAGVWNYDLAWGQDLFGQEQGTFDLQYGVTSFLNAKTGLRRFTWHDQTQTFSLTSVQWLGPFFSVATSAATELLSGNSTNKGGQYLQVAPKARLGLFYLSGEWSRFYDLHSQLVNNEGDRQGDGDQSSLSKASLLFRPWSNSPWLSQLNYQQDVYHSSGLTQQLDLRTYWLRDASSFSLDISKTLPSQDSALTTLEWGHYLPDWRWRLGGAVRGAQGEKVYSQIEHPINDRSFIFANLESWRPFQGLTSVWGGHHRCGDGLCEIEYHRDSPTSNQGDRWVLRYTRQFQADRKLSPISLEYDYREAELLIRACLDQNRNHICDVGERPMAGLRIQDQQSQKEYETDGAGLVRLEVTPYQRLSLQILKESVRNVFISIPDLKTDYMMTPTQRRQIEIPLWSSFELKGKVNIQKGSSHVPVQLVNEQGHVLATANTMANGRYAFDDLEAGFFFVRIDPEYLKNQGLGSSPSQIAVILDGDPGAKAAADLNVK